MNKADKSKRLWLVGAIAILACLGVFFRARLDENRSSEKVTLGDGRYKLIEFGMGVCSQCKRMKPVMEQARKSFSETADVHVLDIRNEDNEILADKFGMRTIPLVVLIDGEGKEVWRHDGFVEYEDLSRAITSLTKPMDESDISDRNSSRDHPRE